MQQRVDDGLQACGNKEERPADTGWQIASSPRGDSLAASLHDVVLS
jgi:hypothetical protein